MMNIQLREEGCNWSVASWTDSGDKLHDGFCPICFYLKRGISLQIPQWTDKGCGRKAPTHVDGTQGHAWFGGLQNQGLNGLQNYSAELPPVLTTRVTGSFIGLGVYPALSCDMRRLLLCLSRDHPLAERNVRLHCEVSGPVKSPGHSDDWKCAQNIVHLRANFPGKTLLGHQHHFSSSMPSSHLDPICLKPDKSYSNPSNALPSFTKQNVSPSCATHPHSWAQSRGWTNSCILAEFSGISFLNQTLSMQLFLWNGIGTVWSLHSLIF